MSRSKESNELDVVGGDVEGGEIVQKIGEEIEKPDDVGQHSDPKTSVKLTADQKAARKAEEEEEEAAAKKASREEADAENEAEALKSAAEGGAFDAVILLRALAKQLYVKQSEPASADMNAGKKSK